MGYTDFAAVGMSAWALLLFMKATEEDDRWYLLAFPMLLVAALTRYTALLFVFPVAVWVVLRWRPFRQARRIAQGVALALAAYIPAAIYYAQRFGDVLFPFVIALRFSEFAGVPGDSSLKAGPAWYLENLHTLSAPEGLSLIAAIVFGVAALGLLSRLMETPMEELPGASRFALAAMGVAPAIVAQFRGGLVARQLTIPLAVAVAWWALAPRDSEAAYDDRVLAGPALDAAVLTWLLVYIDFHSHQAVKVPRYFITMAPGLIYFTLLGWQSWTTTALERLAQFRERETASTILSPGSVMWAALGIWLAAALALTAVATSTEPDIYVAGAKDSAEELCEREDDLSELTVYSDLWPMTSWYTGVGIRPMPFFTEEEAFGHELAKYGADYFATTRPQTFDNYEEMSRNESVVLLRRASFDERELPSIQYLGDSWEDYLETVTDYSFDLMSSGGRYGWEGSAFMDAFTAEELAEHDAVALYGVRWRNRAAAETELTEYVEDGGALVVDASANIGTMSNDLGDTVMFDTVIRRGDVSSDAGFTVQDEFAERHPEIAEGIEAAPFIDEGGGSWHGARYEPLPGAEPLEVLVSLNGRPAVALRRVGEGRVYFVGYNLVWHAFLTESESEHALIEAIFDDALSDEGTLLARDGSPPPLGAER
jgi:hypothetical protein